MVIDLDLTSRHLVETLLNDAQRLSELLYTAQVSIVAVSVLAHWNVEFDDAQGIGKRYRRQDEIGTPFCVTVDFDTLDDQAVTVRERDSMAQERVGLDQVEAYLAARLPGC